MANSRVMTVDELLKEISKFPKPGEPPVKIGDRWYPRSKSDDVPTHVHEAVAQLRKNPGGFRIKLAATDEESLVAVLVKLRRLVFPSRIGSETSRYHAADYVEAWAADNGFKLPPASRVKERH